MYFRFPTCEVGACIFVFLLLRSVRAFSSSYLQDRCVEFHLPTCKAGVWIFVFLLVRPVCGFLFSYF